MRLDKYLTDCGLGSRAEVKQLIKQKRVVVNGKEETSPKRQVDETKDVVMFDGNILTYDNFLYYVMNKPKGVISATEDNHHKTVLDLLEPRARQKAVFPVGRLDIDTHGLLLLTNNGPLAHAMLSPKRHVPKRYEAIVSGIMTEQDQTAFADGIALSDAICKPAELDIISQDEGKNTCLVNITLSEGKFHQVKRMVTACGKEVIDLKRLTMGVLELPDDLEIGTYRRLTESEIEKLAIYGVPV